VLSGAVNAGEYVYTELLAYRFVRHTEQLVTACFYAPAWRLLRRLLACQALADRCYMLTTCHNITAAICHHQEEAARLLAQQTAERERIAEADRAATAAAAGNHTNS
jgi:hypothetical protein